MSGELNDILEHDLSDDCPICRAQELIEAVLVPAAAAWESSNELPRFSVALHGAASLLGVLLEEGIPREELDAALGGLLDDLEQQIAENSAMGGPTQGNA